MDSRRQTAGREDSASHWVTEASIPRLVLMEPHPQERQPWAKCDRAITDGWVAVLTREAQDNFLQEGP